MPHPNFLRALASLVVAFVALCPSSAQTLTRLDWDEMRIDSVLPQYQEVVPLETDYRTHDYRVHILYPEYQPLTSKEQAVAARFADQIADTITVATHVGVMRRRGTLDISFLPVVRREGKYWKLLSAKIEIEAVGRPRRGARRTQGATRQSVLATGRWMKISIETDGMYRLTRAALQKMGFAHPDKVRLFGYGGHLLPEVLDPAAYYDDLEELPLYKVDADTWVFWGDGLVSWNGNTRVFNPYARRASYFLTEGDPLAMPSEKSLSVIPQRVYTSFTDHALYEKDEFAWFSGGRNLYEAADYATNNSHTYKLSTPDSEGDEHLTIAFTAGNDKATVVQPTVNGAPLKSATLSALGSYTYGVASTTTTDVSAHRLTTGDWTVKLVATSGHKAHLDYLALHYTRALRVPAAGFVAFSQTTGGNGAFDIACNPSHTHVLRLGRPGESATLIEGTPSEGRLRVVVGDATRRYVAFDDEAAQRFPQPAVVGAVENQNLHALDSLDMVILIPESGKLRAEAERLADAHREYDGLRVAVVPADKVYNEFSSGTPDATAYRLLMKMLYDRAETRPDTAPRYLLLMGDCAWDNRMISTAWRLHDPADYLLCFESENSLSDTKCYVMEDYFGLLDDGEGAMLTNDKVDLGIGRFPVVTAAEAKVMVDKCVAYMSRQNAGAWKNVVSVLGDDGDSNEHMKYADDVAERIIRQTPALEVRKTMWDAYTRVSTTTNNTYPEVTQIIHDQMAEGAVMVNYTGHGATYCMSHEQVLKLEDFNAFKSPHLPLWVTAACDIMPFDGLAPNIGETAVLNEGGAALAFYGTTRTVYAYNNLQMNRYLCQYLFGTDGAGRRYRLGDAIRLAKTMLITNRAEVSNTENKLHYALLGDPALTIGAPLQRVVLDSINGESASQGDSLMLQAGAHVRLAGHVEDAAGQLIPHFNGTLTTRVYDNLQTVTCRDNAREGVKPFTFTTREGILYNGQDSVVGGRFAVCFVVPADINFSRQGGRAVFYAINDSLTIEANGYNEHFRVGGIDEALRRDTVGPHIVAYLGNDSFENGQTVCPTPYFVAELDDESGIAFSGSGLGHDLTLTIDNDPRTTYNVNAYYTAAFGDYRRGTVAYSVPALPEGGHTLTFRAWDVLGNTSTASFDFWVSQSVRPNVLSLTASQNPAVETTQFLLSYDMPGTPCDFTIDVYDFAGRRVWGYTAHTSTPRGLLTVPWNLCNGQGGRLWPGIYLYRATVSQGGSKRSSEARKIIIANRP